MTNTNAVSIDGANPIKKLPIPIINPVVNPMPNEAAKILLSDSFTPVYRRVKILARTAVTTAPKPFAKKPGIAVG